MNKEKIINNLDMCKVEEYEDYLEVTLPVILSFNSQLITLRIYLRDDCYYVSSTDTLFDEYVEYSANYCEKYYSSKVRWHICCRYGKDKKCCSGNIKREK